MSRSRDARVNDSVTVAVEVPVFLTQEDIRYYRSRGFDLNFESDVITGHIDFLQISNGHIHILDYKPDDAKKCAPTCNSPSILSARSQDKLAAEILQVRLVRRERLF